MSWSDRDHFLSPPRALDISELAMGVSFPQGLISLRPTLSTLAPNMSATTPSNSHPAVASKEDIQYPGPGEACFDPPL